MRSTSARRRLAALAALLLTAGLALTACGRRQRRQLRRRQVARARERPSARASPRSVTSRARRSRSTPRSSLPEDKSQKDSYKLFTDVHRHQVDYEGSRGVRGPARRSGSKAATRPTSRSSRSPACCKPFADAGKVKSRRRRRTSTTSTKFWGEDWKDYGTVDGKFYGAPLGANVKSFVWYSPKCSRRRAGRSRRLGRDDRADATRSPRRGIKPWCAGIESGDATGWPATDWIEDVILRDAGPDVYDQWVDHKIPFNDPQIAEAARPGRRRSSRTRSTSTAASATSRRIATTAVPGGRAPDPRRQVRDAPPGVFYATNWPEGTEVAEDGDVVRLLPADRPTTSNGKPVLGGGEFVALQRPSRGAGVPDLPAPPTPGPTRRPRPRRTATGSAPTRAWTSPTCASPIDKLSGEILQDPDAVFRFDGSDLMPGAVGAGSFWKEMTDWINGQSTKETLDNIEDSWK